MAGFDVFEFSVARQNKWASLCDGAFADRRIGKSIWEIEQDVE
jgi:hypothetical protein